MSGTGRHFVEFFRIIVGSRRLGESEVDHGHLGPACRAPSTAMLRTVIYECREGCRQKPLFLSSLLLVTELAKIFFSSFGDLSTRARAAPLEIRVEPGLQYFRYLGLGVILAARERTFAFIRRAEAGDFSFRRRRADPCTCCRDRHPVPKPPTAGLP